MKILDSIIAHPPTIIWFQFFVFKISFYHNFSNTHLPAKGMTAELFEELEIQVGGQNLGLIMK